VAVKCTQPAAATVFSDGFEGGALGQWVIGTNNASVPATWGLVTKAYTLGYMSGTSMAAPFVSGVAALIWSVKPSSSVAHVKNVLIGSVDLKSSLATKVLSGGRLNAARALQYAPDVSSPTSVAMTGASLDSAFQTSKTFSVGWTAIDTGSGVKSYDVRWERAPYNAGFGAWRNAVTYTGSSLSGLPGSTYCFDARARDKALNISSWSPTRCTALPLDDRSLAASSGWARRSDPATYLGTYTHTTLHNASLKVNGVRFKKLGLVATTCPGCGLVNVYFGSTFVRQLSLAASATAREQILWIRSYPSIAGPVTVTLVVASSGKAVRIDGLGIEQA
jgi:hypothetical protein